jgi:hypothetical protein
LLSLVLSQISPAAGANQRDALKGLGIDADRGYWKWKLLATFMHLGANIDGSTLVAEMVSIYVRSGS